MKLPVLAAVVLAGTSLALLPACKSEKEVAHEVATRNVQSFQATLDQIPPQIDKVMGSLGKLTSGATGDRPQQLADFSRDLSVLKNQGAQVASARDDAEKDVQRYFREWIKESRGIKSTPSREAAYKSLDAGRARADMAMSYIRDGSRDFRALLDKLSGFEQTLKSDLSPASIRRVGDQYSIASDDAIKVKGAIARLNDQIDSTLTGG